ncbi:hypothetical protein [Shimazuella kribbensis]|uniref:hypothetical protein n=1 Tax=Shimazuella kribbensis TaxID=139808 RepID=UPI000490B0BA|nr:hypothetical protein [Shimazuella kribbensis]
MSHDQIMDIANEKLIWVLGALIVMGVQLAVYAKTGKKPLLYSAGCFAFVAFINGIVLVRAWIELA